MGRASKGKKDGEPSRRDKVEAMQQEESRAQRRRNLLWVLGGVAAVALVAGLSYASLSGGPEEASGDRDALAADVTTYPVDTPDHTADPVSYPQNPPVGGDHNPVWLNCGIYDAPVPDENAVHSLEHGAVWVTYDPALSSDEAKALQDAMPSSYIILSPYDGLPSPVVASAWGVQIELDGADDPRLQTFLDVYRQGSQTPEPGAACDGGVGEPVA